MGRIVVQVIISNVLEPYQIRCDALVDTGTGGLVLPEAWKERLGPFPASRRVEMETADQRVVTGEVCGLEQSRLAVDPVGHRLVRLKYMDLK
jgi:predicted aspartyl protease